MLSRNIKPGDKIEIIKKNNQNLPAAFSSRVEAMIDPRNLFAQMPVFDGNEIRLDMEAGYSVLVFTERGVFGFQAKIMSYTRRNGVPVMKMELTTEGEKVQRREYFRFYPCMLPMHFSKIDPLNPTAEGTQLQGVVRDLSGNGCRFISNEVIDTDVNISCFVALGDEVLVAVGKVLSKQQFEKYAFKFQYRVRFVGILDKECQKILQFISNEQRKIILQAGRSN